jgi:hypothetical protein
MYARGEGDRPPPGTLNQLFFTGGASVQQA